MGLIINSVSEYVSAINKINSTLVRNGAEKNEMLLFRGQSDNLAGIILGNVFVLNDQL